MNSRIGFMQGRLSPQVNGRIQAFPWNHWQEEFHIAHRLGFPLIEWTLDQDRLRDNPLLTDSGQTELRRLSSSCGVSIVSVTGDCFMQAPFWKASSSIRQSLQEDFEAVIAAAAILGIRTIVVPLVDDGRIENANEQDILMAFLTEQFPRLARAGVQIAFESDLEPAHLAEFIRHLSPVSFGINYDIGNSAALGLAPREEFAAYGRRITNVHVKDRKLGGTTVPLGEGNADFEVVFAELQKLGYRGNYILQTARAADGNHNETLCRYRDMTAAWLERYGS